MNIRDRIEALLSHLNRGVYEKETAIQLALLTAIAGESIFMLGAPGVAKSLVARRLKLAFKDARAFEYLMSRFSTPDEIFGPVSISKLKNEDKYERIISGYLPAADVVFLDEIWKAGPSIQNALLTVLNEKIYRNGDREERVPIKGIISASNELPSRGEGLEALWDRFLVRILVEGIQEPGHFEDMICMVQEAGSVGPDLSLQISAEEYAECSTLIDMVSVGADILQIIHTIRCYIQRYNEKQEDPSRELYISDRRWRKIIRLLRTSAYLNGRDAVDLMDCFLIQYCIWDEPSQISQTRQFVIDAISQNGYKLDLSLEDIKESIKEVRQDVIQETRTKTTISVEEPELVHLGGGVNAYKIKDFFKFGQEGYIRKEDYDSLPDGRAKSLTLYNSHGEPLNTSSYYGYRASFSCVREDKGENIGCLNIDGNAYELETKTIERKQTVIKRPHRAIVANWDKVCAEIQGKLKQAQERIDNYRLRDLHHVRTNLFVSPYFAPYVETCLDQLKKEIGRLEVEVKRLQYSYFNIKPGTVVSSGSKDEK
jgi:hypothetical protein